MQLQDILQTANFMRHELCVYGYVTAVAAATSAYCMYTLYMPAYLVRTKFIRFSLGKILLFRAEQGSYDDTHCALCTCKFKQPIRRTYSHLSNKHGDTIIDFFSILHVYWFLTFFPPSTPRFRSYVLVFFQKILPSTFIKPPRLLLLHPFHVYFRLQPSLSHPWTLFL